MQKFKMYLLHLSSNWPKENGLLEELAHANCSIHAIQNLDLKRKNLEKTTKKYKQTKDKILELLTTLNLIF